MIALTPPSAAVARYVDVGFVHVSWGNIAVIVSMLVLFVLAVLLPFPGGHDRRRDGSGR